MRLTRPVNVQFTLPLIPNSDVLETYCAEGNLDQPFLRGQPRSSESLFSK